MNGCRSEPTDGQFPLSIYLREHQTCQCGGLNDEQVGVLRDRFARYLGIGPSWLPGQVELSARQYVGTIALPDLRIIIEPKVTLENLFFMLTYAYDLPQFRRENITLASSDDLFEFIVDLFLSQVELLVRRGIYRTYVNLEENHRFLRGRLLVADHLRQNTVQVNRLYQRINEFTANVLENRVLKYTLWLLSRIDFSNRSLRIQLRRCASAFAETGLLKVTPADCDQVIYTRLNAGYRTPIHLARLLLQHLSLEGQAGDMPFAAYLFDMNKVFELFVARYLERYFAANALVQVDIQAAIWLDEARKEKGVPDIVLRRLGRPFLVLDTKYKVFDQKPSEYDRNQMFVYCHTMDLSEGILIYANDRAISYESQLKGVNLKARAISLAGDLDQFRAGCQAFASSFEGLVTTGI